MAANLTPQYLKAEEEYRRAQSPDEELRWLQVMLQEIPKHKASEKMQMMLKTKIADAKKRGRSVARRREKRGRKVGQNPASGRRNRDRYRRSELRKVATAELFYQGEAGSRAVSVHDANRVAGDDGLGRRFRSADRHPADHAGLL
ncbi:MAG: hypothetical protein IIW01_00750 [Thermoguttaceae bacterium]|nr:hypothetical protein [Thermoguttaceae bacterium]